MQGTVVIAGASGFVGRALCSALRADYRVVALSRSSRFPVNGVEQRPCDLFSLLQTERALEGADYAVYLVHSMLPARLTQASFADMDLILADNFARAAKMAGVRQILYLGGLIPSHAELSPHLASRLEVERVLGAHGVPVTGLRAGLILGAGGSSFQVMMRLVKHLPVMLCPRWTQTLTRPIALGDVVKLIQHALGRESCFGQVYDIGGPDKMSYVEMMHRAARVMGLRRLILPVPLLTPQLSVMWVCLVTGAHRELIKPLVESLRHEMVGRDFRLQEEAGVKGVGFEEALRTALREEQERLQNTVGFTAQELARKDPRHRQGGYVVSIQRLPLPVGRTAEWVAREYARWLPTLFRHVIWVEVDDRLNLRFRLLGLKVALLELSFSGDRSSADRPLYYITGGLLNAPQREVDGRAPARLEFRQTTDGRYVMAAIFNFRPRLPWVLYRLSQAPFHLWVMNQFALHLKTVTEQAEKQRAPK